MRRQNLVIGLLVLVLCSCLQRNHGDQGDSPETSKEVSTIEPRETLKTWIEAVNLKNPDAIGALYANKAVKVISKDSILHDAKGISKYYLNRPGKIAEVQSIFITSANRDEGIDYELIRYKTENSGEYVQLVIWRMEGRKRVREFEYDVKRDVSGHNDPKDEISRRRYRWIQLCNAHKAENLVTQLYTSDAIYFNHKPLVIGTEAISRAYGYMNENSYSLTLEPLKVEMVREDMAFEIGQCKGSYGGKYVIVWKKEAGRWKVFIDSNF